MNTKIRFLFAGAWNTFFGYCIGLLLYESFSTRFHIVAISLVANIIAITSAFFTYKILVFKTRGNWLFEYLRCYITYGGMAIIGTVLIWLFVDILQIDFWIAQFIVIVITTGCSYFLHKIYTFSAASH
jgi:putative flippase GtrA